MQLTAADGRAEVTADSLAGIVGFSRPSMLKALRTIEERELGQRARTPGGNVFPLFLWNLERLPSLINRRAETTAGPVESTPRELWQEVFSEAYREHFSRDTEAGPVSAIVPSSWPKDPGWEELTDWSARRSVELGVDARRVVELACETFLSFGDKVDARLTEQGHPLSFMPRLLRRVDQAVVARLTQPARSAARERKRETPANETAPARVPSMSEIEETIASLGGVLGAPAPTRRG